MRVGRHVAVLMVFLMIGCSQPREPAPVERSLVVPEPWSGLGVPSTGAVRILSESDAHGIYVDYDGVDRDDLLAEVASGLESAGYSQVCTAVDGWVLGFSNGQRRLALKVDLLPEAALSLFDEYGMDPILHGLCFGGYSAGPWRTLTQEEKESFAYEIESADEDEGSTGTR